jgi:hypothetical protein
LLMRNECEFARLQQLSVFGIINNNEL